MRNAEIRDNRGQPVRFTAPGFLEPNVLETAVRAGWDFIRNKFHSFFRRTRELKWELEASHRRNQELERKLETSHRRVQELERKLAQALSGDRQFERLMSTLVSRPEDDSMYWMKDGSGGPFCPLCLNSDRKQVPLTHGNREGTFYCRIHNHFFETAIRRRLTAFAYQVRQAQLGRRSNMAESLTDHS